MRFLCKGVYLGKVSSSLWANTIFSWPRVSSPLFLKMFVYLCLHKCIHRQRGVKELSGSLTRPDKRKIKIKPRGRVKVLDHLRIFINCNRTLLLPPKRPHMSNISCKIWSPPFFAASCFLSARLPRTDANFLFGLFLHRFSRPFFEHLPDIRPRKKKARGFFALPIPSIVRPSVREVRSS